MPKSKKRSIPRWKKLLAAAMASVTIGAGAMALRNLPPFAGEKVVEVVDGDTFIIENRQPIRLYGLDAPALENCMGQDARKALSNLILNKRVLIKEPLSDGRGRVMALIYIDGKLVNEIIIRTGLAQFRRQGGSETERMKVASDYARENSIGIYSPICYQTEPPNPKCAIKGNYDEHRAEKIYFTPACNYYSMVTIQKHQGDDWFCTESEAQKSGFTQAETCKK